MHSYTLVSIELAEYARTQSISNPCLDCENSNYENTEFGEYDGELFYEEPDLSGGIEFIDYVIVYGTEGGEAEAEE